MPVTNPCLEKKKRTTIWTIVILVIVLGFPLTYLGLTVNSIDATVTFKCEQEEIQFTTNETVIGMGPLGGSQVFVISPENATLVVRAFIVHNYPSEYSLVHGSEEGMLMTYGGADIPQIYSRIIIGGEVDALSYRRFGSVPIGETLKYSADVSISVLLAVEAKWNRTVVTNLGIPNLQLVMLLHVEDEVVNGFSFVNETTALDHRDTAIQLKRGLQEIEVTGGLFSRLDTENMIANEYDENKDIKFPFDARGTYKYISLLGGQGLGGVT